MYIRQFTGAYAGEVRDVAFEAAKRLIQSGQAEAVDFNPPSPRSERVESVSIEGKPVDVVAAKAPEPVRMPIIDKNSKKKSR